MAPGLHITHGPRRRWWRPWQRICRCGIGAWPCPVVTMLERHARAVPATRRNEVARVRRTGNVRRLPVAGPSTGRGNRPW